MTLSRSSIRTECHDVKPITRARPLQGSYNTSSSGELGTLEYRLYTLQDGDPVSAWHGVPLYAEDGTMNFVCEIPANTTDKFEVQTKEPGTPIAQDEKNGLPRDYAVPILQVMMPCR